MTSPSASVETGDVSKRIYGRVLSLLRWSARNALVLAISVITLAHGALMRAPNDGRAGLLSVPVVCADYAATLRDWQDLMVEVAASFSTPSVEDCRTLVERQPNNPHAPLAYAISHLRTGDPQAALAVLRASAQNGGFAAAHTLAVVHMEEHPAAVFKIDNSSAAALRILEEYRFEPNANTNFLLFKAYNTTGDVNHSFRATYNLLRALSLGSKQAQLYISTAQPEKSRLRHGPKIILRAILNEMGFPTSNTSQELGVADYVALGKFLQARPAVGADGCITVQDRQKCYTVR